MSQKLSAGQTWLVRVSERSGAPRELVVHTLGVGPPCDKGYREVECLVLEGPGEGTAVKLSNGAFSEPNKRLA